MAARDAWVSAAPGRRGARQAADHVVANYEAFEKLPAQTARANAGRFALMREGKLAAIFDTARDARLVGERLYSDGRFSLQEFEAGVVDMGFFSAF